MCVASPKFDNDSLSLGFLLGEPPAAIDRGANVSTLCTPPTTTSLSSCTGLLAQHLVDAPCAASSGCIEAKFSQLYSQIFHNPFSMSSKPSLTCRHCRWRNYSAPRFTEDLQSPDLNCFAEWRRIRQAMSAVGS